VFEYGALNTGTPLSIAASRSTWLVPMQKRPTAASFLPGFEDRRRDVRARSNPRK
jgi:hypothetical protein